MAPTDANQKDPERQEKVERTGNNSGSGTQGAAWSIPCAPFRADYRGPPHGPAGH